MTRSHAFIATYLAEQGLKEAQVALHSQIPVVPFYARLGYVPVGYVFDEEGAPHHKMVLTIHPAPESSI